MGKELRSCVPTYFIAFLFLLFSQQVNYVHAQVVLNDYSAREISFTLAPQDFNPLSDEFSVEHLNLLSGQNDNPDLSLTSTVTDEDSGINYSVRQNEYGVTAVGQNRISAVGTTTFFAISFKNETGEAIDGLNLAFDFEYGLEASESPFTMLLQIRVNNGEWQSVNGGLMRSSMLTSGSEPWNSVSVQANTEDIYLRTNDRVDVRWVASTTSGDLINPPFGIQHIEVIPRQSRITAPERGSLFITEILPRVIVDGTTVEYIEVYNSSEAPVSLKGLEIIGTGGVHVIQKDHWIAPYSFAVISNQNTAGLEAFDSTVSYSGSLFSEDEGVAELRMNGILIQSLRYQNDQMGSALELINLEQALDGRTNFSDLATSTAPRINGISGSPGKAGNSGRFFSKEITGRGWHLVSLPGYWNDFNTSRQSVLMADLSMNDRFNPTELYGGEPFLIQKNNSESYRVYSQEYRDQILEPYLVELGDEALLAGFASPDSLSLWQLVNERNERLAPVIQHWNAEKQEFELVFEESDAVSGWEPIIMNRDAAPELKRVTDRQLSRGEPLSQYIRFRLFEERGNRQIQADEDIILGFLPDQAQQSGLRYDLPKILPISDPNEFQVNRELSLFYLSGQESASAHSFTHLPNTLDEGHTVSLGHFSTGSARNFTLNWENMERIPDGWVLTLEDTQTGNRIDMLETESYTFRSAGGEQLQEQVNNITNPIQPFTPQKSERFEITIEPFRGAMVRTEEPEKPGSVELRQNYPNPFNPSTTITFYLPEERPVRLGVYNVVGQQVALLVDESRPEGEHAVTWNASEMPSGIYIVQLEIGNRMLTRKITLIK